MSTISDEIELLEKVLFRLGSCDTDEQLEANVLKFLAPVLLKITSPNETVRCKVMEVLTHTNKRLKSRPAIQLPVDALLRQYQTSTSTFLQNFSIIYLTMGFPRLTVEKQTDLAPMLLNCLEGKSENHQDKLLMLVLPLLKDIKIPEDDEKRKSLLGLGDKPGTKKQFLALLQDVLLLPYGVTAEADVPPGLSQYSFKRVIANNWKAEELESMKQGVCRIIGSGVFSDIDVLPLLILASADTRFSVVTPAIAELNKINSTLDWSDSQLSEPIYTLFLGNGSKITDRKTSGCSARVRQKLLQYLLKDRTSGTNTIRGIQILFEGLFGEHTNVKCRVLALQFAESLIKNGSKDIITKVSKVILSGVSKLIVKDTTETVDVQSAAYCTLAQLARVCPDILNKDLQYVVGYFEALRRAPIELQSPIRETLIALAPAFSWDRTGGGAARDFKPTSNQTLLLAMLSEQIESNINIVQNVVTVFLTVCYPEHYVPARFLLLLTNDEKSSLNETLNMHLYGATRKDNIDYTRMSSIDFSEPNEPVTDLNHDQRSVVLPNFNEMAVYVDEMVQKRLSNSSEKHVYGKVTLPFSYETYTEILYYLRLCLWYSAGLKRTEPNQKYRQTLETFIRNSIGDRSIDRYLSLLKKVLYAKRGHIELLGLYDLLDVGGDRYIGDCIDLIDIFGQALRDISEVTRILVAKVFGILMTGERSVERFDDQIKRMISQLPQSSLEHKHGITLALAHAVQRQLKKGVNVQDSLNEVVKILVSQLNHQQALLASAAINGLSLIGSTISLPLPEPLDPSTDCTKTYIFDTLVKLLKSAHTRSKLREEVAVCLGSLAIGDPDYFTERNLQTFLSLLKASKDVSFLIAVAQAIVFTILHADYTVISDGTDHDMDLFRKCNDSELDKFLLALVKVVPDPNTFSRTTSAIWLLALVKNFSKRSPIYSKKQLLQFAFTELLSDDSEFVQDVASRGLGLVFSLSDSSSQNSLANSLLDQLIGGKRQVQQVTEDSQLFEEGVLGKTPTGGNITTYKELCSLASDLNQPEMIYQFMQLANHNAVWTSKLGAAFGLKSISAEAKDQMQPYLGKIVPRLYRYKYDPTPKIQNSMISIWDSIITDPKETVERYYWDIFDELTTNLTHIEWRVRIACCLAVRDLIKRANGLRLKLDDKIKDVDEQMDVDEPIEPQLNFLWSQLFRVMDDVHEGTRLAADGTAKALSKICIIAAGTAGKSGQAVCGSILPLILDTGVTHTVPEIRMLSLKTLSEIIDKSGTILTPHLVKLVPCLLKATGELEVSKLSYLSTRLGANVEAQEAVDSVRAEAAKQNQSMETLSKCIRYMTYDVLDRMTGEVIELMKTTVNLGTKIACAHFICLITVRFGTEMTPLVPKYLGACFYGLKDRNNVVRKYNASAIGHLAGIAKEQSIIRLFGKLSESYMENQGNRSIPQALLYINKRHQDILKDYFPHVLPLIFFAMHEVVTDENRDGVDMWKELWTDVSPGDAGIRLNLEAIVPMLKQSLDQPSWLMKAQSANAITTIARRLDDNLPDEYRRDLITALLASVSGRTFEGKERVLEALASLTKSLKKDQNELSTQIIQAVMKECRKEEPIYRTHALRAAGTILEQLTEDRFEELYNMVWYLMEKKDVIGDEDKQQTSDERSKRANIVINLKEAICEALGRAWPISIDTQDKYQLMFAEQCVQCLQTNTRTVQLALLVALGKFLERLKLLEKKSGEMGEGTGKKAKVEMDNQLNQICRNVLSAVVHVAGIPYTSLKKEALNIVFTLVKRLSDINNIDELTMVRTTFVNLLETLQKDSSPEVKCRLKDIEDKLKSTT